MVKYTVAMLLSLFFLFNDTATTEIYTLSLHDALPISHARRGDLRADLRRVVDRVGFDERSEEHTSELQSRQYLVCRLLLEKKKPKAVLGCTTIQKGYVCLGKKTT